MSVQHTPFNPEGKTDLTIRECLAPAMQITDAADAAQYLAAYVDYIQRWFDVVGRNEAQLLARRNLGYYAGYCDHETSMRVESLFDCRHPVFGKASAGKPTAQEAFAAGVDMAKARGGAS